MNRIILGAAAVATGVGFWLNQPYGVVALGLAFLYVAFERGVAIGERIAVAKEDSTRAVVALADRVSILESAVQKYELAEHYRKVSR